MGFAIRGAAKAAEKRPRHEVVQHHSVANSEEDLEQPRQATEATKDKKSCLQQLERKFVFMRKMIVKGKRPSHQCFTPSFDYFAV